MRLSNIIIVKCAFCKKHFNKFKYPRKGGRATRKNIRRSDCVTCSHKCARGYSYWGKRK